MTKKLAIAIDKPVIDIELGEITLEFPIDDDSLLKIRNQADDLQTKADELTKKYGYTEIRDFEPHKELLQKAYDSFFGPGTFEKVYLQTPSVRSCTKYFLAICEHLTRELQMDKELEQVSARFLRKK